MVGLSDWQSQAASHARGAPFDESSPILRFKSSPAFGIEGQNGVYVAKGRGAQTQCLGCFGDIVSSLPRKPGT